MSSYKIGKSAMLVGGTTTAVQRKVAAAAGEAGPTIPLAREPFHTSDRLTDERESAAFLQKATMGPRLNEVMYALNMGSKRAWIEEQLSMRLSKRYCDRAYIDYGEQNFSTFQSNLPIDGAVLSAHVTEPAALRVKCTWLLSNLFIISQPGGAFADPGTVYSFLPWYDRLDKYVFGNWRDLIESVTYSLQMSRMLSYYGNKKATGTSQPDENYARELLQLFSIGLWELELDGTYKLDESGQRIPTYGTDDVRQIARCLTGLTRWDFNNSSQRYDSPDQHSMDTAASDVGAYNGRWLFGDPDMRLRHYLPFYEYGPKFALGGRVNIPEGTDPVRNLAMLHDAIFNHPNTAPFFATRMIQRMVTSNPSPAYVRRVAAAFEDNGAGVRGDLKAVWMAILTDPEAANSGLSDPMHGRVRDGWELYVNMMRSLERKNNVGNHTLNAANGTVESYMAGFGPTAPRMSPSIFGPYDAMHAPAGLAERGLMAPELGMWSDVLLVRGNMELLNATNAGTPGATPDANRNISDYSMLSLASDPPQPLVDMLDLLLCGGHMTPALRAEILNVITPMPIATTANRQDRATVAIQLVLNSPDYWVQL